MNIKKFAFKLWRGARLATRVVRRWFCQCCGTSVSGRKPTVRCSIGWLGEGSQGPQYYLMCDTQNVGKYFQWLAVVNVWHKCMDSYSLAWGSAGSKRASDPRLIHPLAYWSHPKHKIGYNVHLCKRDFLAREFEWLILCPSNLSEPKHLRSWWSSSKDSEFGVGAKATWFVGNENIPFLWWNIFVVCSTKMTETGGSGQPL